MDNQNRLVVTTPPQQVIISVDAALLGALADLNNQLGMLLAEVREGNRMARDHYALADQQIQAQMQWDRTTSAIAAALTPQEGPQGPAGQSMVQTALVGATGPQGAVQDSTGASTDVPVQTDPIPEAMAVDPDPGIMSQNAAPAVVSPQEAYAVIKDQWVLDEAANPLVRNPDGTTRPMTAAEMAGWSQQMGKAKKGRR